MKKFLLFLPIFLAVTLFSKNAFAQRPIISYTSPVILQVGVPVNISPNVSQGTVASASVTPALPAGLTLNANGTITGTPTAVTAAATYNITPRNAGGNAQTANPLPTINITVVKPTLTITANDVSKVYGNTLTGAPGSNAFTTTGLQNGETVVSVTLAYAGGSASTANVGNYNNTVTPSAAVGTYNASYYNIVYLQGDINVTPAPLTLTATGPTKTYGTALAAVASTTNFTATGAIAGQTVTSVTLTPNAAGASATTAAGAAYTVTPSAPTGTGGFAASNYTITANLYNGTVAKASLTITAAVPNKPYGTVLTGAAGSANFTSTGLQNGNTVGSVTIAYGLGAAANAAVGSYPLQATVSAATGGTFAAANYNITYAQGNINVVPAALNIMATNVSKVYGTTISGGSGSTAFSSTGLQNGETIGSVTITDGTGSAATAAVNTYAGQVVPSAATGGSFNASNYTITYTGGNIIVTPAPLTLTATGPLKPYGTALTTGAVTTNFTASGTITGETVTSVTLTPNAAGLSATTAAGVAYTVTPSAPTGTGGFAAGNYTITAVIYNGTVTQAPLTITAAVPNKQYGTTLTNGSTATSFTSAGLKNGNTIGSVTIAYGTGAAPTDALGNYPLQATVSAATGGTFVPANYIITYVQGDINVTPATLTITATDVMKPYSTTITGGPSSTAFTSTGLGNGETIGSVTIAYGTGSAAMDAAGTYANQVTPSAATGGTFNPSNYNIIYAGGSIIVNKVALTITATGPPKVYGTALTAGASTTNFTTSATIPGETVTSVTLTPDAAGASATTVAGATYNIIPSAPTGTGGFSAGNYNITYVNFTGTVTQAPLSVTANVPNKQYGTTLTNGSTTTAFSSSGLKNGNTIGSVTIAYGTGAAPSAAIGNYPLQATVSAATGGTFNAANYIITYVQGDINVVPATLTITATDVSKTYGTALTGGAGSTAFTATGLGNGETVGSVTIAYGGAAAATATPGTYAAQVTASAATGGTFNPSNYIISYVQGSIIVNKFNLTITATGPAKTYGTALTAGASTTNFTATATQPGETVTSVTLTPNAAGTSATTAAGAAYIVVPSAATGNGGFLASNYNITYVNFNGTVAQAPLTITANAISKTYGTALTTAAGSIAFTSVGLKNGNTIGSVTIAYGAGGAANAAVGSYPLMVTVSAATGGTFTASNYSITYVQNTLTINPAALTITANNVTKTYGNTLTGGAGSTAFTTTGLKNGETVPSVTIAYGTGSAAGAALGTYSGQITLSAAIAGGAFNPANYTITYGPGDITVVDRIPVISYTPSTNVYTVGTAIPPLTPTNTGGPVPTAGFGAGTVLAFPAISQPMGMDFDAAGNLYVAMASGNIRKMTPGGVFSTFGPTFNTPSGIVFDSAGNGYVLDRNTDRLYKLNAAGTVTNTYNLNNLNNPYAITIDASDYIYITDITNNNVTKFNTVGVPVATFSSNVTTPRGVAVDASNNVYVLNSGTTGATRSVTVYNLSGVYQSTLVAGLSNPSSIAVDNNGNIYVGDSNANTVTEYNAAGTVLTTISGTNDPRGIVIDKTGNLFISDYTNNTVTQYPPTGGYTVDGNLPPGISFDSRTGTFSGTPTASFPATTYTVRCVNTGGTASTTVTLSCTITPPNISYTPSTNAYPLNNPIPTLSPVNTGAPVSPLNFGTGVPNSAGTLNGPSGIGIDNNGNVYVTNFNGTGAGANTVSKYGPTGNYIGTFGTGGPGYSQPIGIVFDSSGNAYVLNIAGTIYKYNAAGVYQSTIVTGLVHPLGIAIDANNNLFVADQTPNKVYRYTTAGGAPTLTINTGTNTAPTDVATDAAGNIYVLNRQAGTIVRYTSTGTSPVTLVNGLNLPYSIHIDSGGNIYVGNSGGNTVNVYSPSGAGITTFGVNDPEGITIDKNGNVYVSSFTVNQLYKYVPKGGYTISPNLPAGLSFDSTTGNVTGTPTVTFPPTVFTVTAYGYGAQSTTTITLSCYVLLDWVGTQPGGDWNNPLNWASKVVPGLTDDAKIGVNNAFTYPPVIYAGATTVNVASVLLGNVGGQAPGITVNFGYTLNVTGDITKQSDANSNFNYTTYLAGAGTINAANLNIKSTTLTASAAYTETVASSINSLVLSGNVALTSNLSTYAFNSTFNITGGTTSVAGKIITSNNSGGTSTVSVNSATTATLQLANMAALSSLSATGTNIFSVNNPGAVVEYSGAAQTVYTDAPIAGLSTPLLYNGIAFSGTGIKTPTAGNLTINGNFTNTMANDAANYPNLINTPVLFNGAAATLKGGPGNGTIFNNVTFNATATKTMASGNFYITSTGMLTMAGSASANVLAANGFLTLRSDLNGSAIIPAINGPSITGNVNVERYISGGAGYRGYRLLSSPVNAGGGRITVNYIQKSSYLTGTTGTGGGFDAAPVNNPTLYLFRENLMPDNTSFISGNYRGINNILSAPTYSFDTDGGGFNIPIGNGYLFFYRGDRTLAPLASQNSGYTPTATSLTATGTLNQGSFTFNTWYTPAGTAMMYSTISGAPGIEGFNLVGNPYPSSIDWDNSTSNGGSGIVTSDVGPFIYILDPVSKNYNVYKSGTPGGQGTIPSATKCNIISSGQGFFVIAASTAATLTFTESAKTNAQVAAANGNLFMGVPPALANIPSIHMLLTRDSTNLDGIFINFDNNSKGQYVINEDAPHKIGLSTSSLSSRSADNISLAYNTMPLPKTSQVIPLSVGAGADGIYQLKMSTLTNIPAIYEVWLKDALTKDSLDVRHNPNYSFNVVKADTNTYGNSRFTLVIRQNPALGLHLLSFTGQKALTGDLIVWKVENEQNYTNFTLERSIDNGSSYQILGGFLSNAQGTYSYTDKSPGMANNMYRLKLEDLNGNITYSNVIIIGYGNLANSHTGINLYPNPTAGPITMVVVDDNRTAALNPGAASANAYTIKIVNVNGAVVVTAKSATVSWQSNVSKLAPGTYIIQVTNNNTNKVVGKTTFVKL